MESKKRREMPEFETIQAAIKVTPKQSIIYFPIFSHLSTASAKENMRMNLEESIMCPMNI